MAYGVEDANPRDEKLAAQYYRRAGDLLQPKCDAGDLEACSSLGLLYDKGWGVEKDQKRGARYHEAACAGGIPEACQNLGNSYSQGWGVGRDTERAAHYYRKGVEAFRKRCEERDGDACLLVGFAFLNGHGMSKDTATARSYFRKACALAVEDGCAALETEE